MSSDTASATAAAAATSAARGQRGYLNLYDMPELLPGAQPSANPAQREQFEERCRHLHKEEELERETEAQEQMEAAGAGDADLFSALEAMFPNLEASLVRSIRQESSSAQAALEILLQLSSAAASVGEVDGTPVVVPQLPPRDLGVEDHEKFPSLVDKDGWQVATAKQFETAGQEAEELGSVWRDRAKAAAAIEAPPAPKPAPNAWGAEAAAKRKEKAERKAALAAAEDRIDPLTEYEYRQQAGLRRAKHQAKYASKAAARRGQAIPGGAGAGGGYADDHVDYGHGHGAGGGGGGGGGGARGLLRTNSDSESELSDEELIAMA